MAWTLKKRSHPTRSETVVDKFGFVGRLISSIPFSSHRSPRSAGEARSWTRSTERTDNGNLSHRRILGQELCPGSEMSTQPLGLFIQPACLQHKYIRHPNSSHIFERPERLRAVLLGVAAAVARLEFSVELPSNQQSGSPPVPSVSTNDDLSSLLSSLSIASTAFVAPSHLNIVTPPLPGRPGQILQHHPALQLAHSPPPDEHLFQASKSASSTYLRDLLKWATEAVEQIKETGCEIPSGLGLNQGDLYLAPGSVLAIEGAVSRLASSSRTC